MNENKTAPKKSVPLSDIKENKEKCPKCGNKIFWIYGSINGIPQSIKCSACSTGYELKGENYIEY